MSETQLFIDATGRGVETKVLPLTWAQANMWESILAFGPNAHRLNFGMAHEQRPLYPSLEQVVTGLRRFVGACDIARTTFDPAQGTQIIRPAVTVPVHVASGDDAVAANRELLAEMERSSFSLEDEPPIRFGIVTSGDEVLSIATVHSHLAFDLPSMGPFMRLLEGSLNGIAEVTRQSEDLVRHEASDRMQQRSDATLQQWADELSGLPAGCGLRLTAPGSFTEWELQSRAIAVAAQTIAARTGVSATSVILAALTTVLRSTLIAPPSAMLLVCNNRHHPDLAEYAGIALQNALYMIPQEGQGGEFDSYVKSAHKSAMRGYTRARYDTDRWRTMLGEMSVCGAAPDLSFYFNDARTSTAWEGLESRVEELKSWSSSDSEVTSFDHRSLNDATLFLNLLDDGTNARIIMACDDALIPPAQAVAILQDLEEFLVKRALRTA